MNLNGKKLTIQDYEDAFNKLDLNNSGYIEISEIRTLFTNVYATKSSSGSGDDDDDDDGNKSKNDNDDVPIYEITAFLDFFDKNEDGKISWEEFKKGLAANNNVINNSAKEEFANLLLASMEDHNDSDDDDNEN